MVIPMLAIDGKHKELRAWLEGKQSPIGLFAISLPTQHQQGHE